MTSFKKPAATSSLVWDAFPEPPPEAKDWKPDPDSIAKPGRFKDPRFNRDPYAEEKKAALKRELRLHGHSSVSEDDTSSSTLPAVDHPASTCPIVEDWPAQIPRSPNHRHSTPRFGSYPTNRKVSEPIKRPTTQVSQVADHQSPTTHIMPSALLDVPTSSLRKYDVAKETTENMIMFKRPQNQPQASIVGSSRSISPEKGIAPAWAGPLEKLLAESISKQSTTTAKSALVSIPPHLRKIKKVARAATDCANGQQGNNLSPISTSYSHSISLEARYEAAEEASRRVSNTSASAIMNHQDQFDDNALDWILTTADLGSKDVQEGAKLRERTLQKYGDEQLTYKKSSDELRYQRYLDVALIKLMEDELDVEKGTTRAELTSMKETDFNNHFKNIKSAHRGVWIASQQAENSSNAQLKADLALFQAREHVQFGNKAAESRDNGLPSMGHINGI